MRKSLVLMLLCIGISSLAFTACEKEAKEEKTEETTSKDDAGTDDDADSEETQDEEADNAVEVAEAAEVTEEAVEEAAEEVAEEVLSNDEIWAETLENLVVYMSSRDKFGYDEDEPEEFYGLDEILNLGEGSEDIGYSFYDLDGDKCDELLIGLVNPAENETSDLTIYSAFAMRDKTPVNIIIGWSRNRYYVLNDNTILNEGSSGAASNSCTIYKLEEGSKELTCMEQYFTEPDDDWNSIGVYYNTNGNNDIRSSERVDNMPDTAIINMEEEHEAKMVKINYTPLIEFAGYSPEGERAAKLAGKPFDVDYASNIKESANAREIVLDDPNVYEDAVAIKANQRVTDFRIVQFEYSTSDLFYPDVYKFVYVAPVVEEDSVIKVYLRLPEVRYTYGIMYTTENGVSYTKAIDVSGYDGSVSLQRIYY